MRSGSPKKAGTHRLAPPTRSILWQKVISMRFSADYWKSFDAGSANIGDHAVQLLQAKARRQRLIAIIERRIGTPALKARNWYRVMEIVAHSVADESPRERSRLLVSF